MSDEPVRGFSWLAGATVAHVAEYRRKGGGTAADPWRHGWESICRYNVWTPYAVDGETLVHYSRHELPDGLAWCSQCRRIVTGRAAGWAEAGLLVPAHLPPPR